MRRDTIFYQLFVQSPILLFDWQAVVIYPSRSIEQSRREIVRELLGSGRITRVYLDELGAV